jgi:hypothetical protein
MKLRKIVCWLCAYTCAVICLLSSQAWLDHQGFTAILYYDKTYAPTFQEAARFMESENIRANGDIVLISAWTQGSGVQLENENHFAKADLLNVQSGSPHILPQQFIMGNMPSDGSQCIAMDENSAFKLFGSTHVIGRSVKLNGKTLEICGVFSSTKGLPSWGTSNSSGLEVIPASANEKVQAIGLLLKPSLQETVSHATGLCAQLGAPFHVEDRNLQASFIRQFGWLPLWFSALAAIISLLKSIWIFVRHPKSFGSRTTKIPQKLHAIILRILTAAGGLTAAWIILRLVNFSPVFPLSWLPTRWSDFDHWANLASTLGKEWVQIRSLPVLSPDLPRLTMIIVMLFFGVLSFVVRIPKEAKPSLQHLICASLLPLPALLLANLAGLELNHIPALFLFPAFRTLIQLFSSFLPR